MSLEDDVLRFDPAAYAIAQARVTAAPIELTEPDFDQLAIVSTRLEDEAREAKRLAQLALVQPVPDTAIRTKSVAPAPPESMDEWVKKHGKKTVTGAVLMGVVDVLMECLKQNKVRVDNLEQRNQELSMRVLELEARNAAHEAVTP